MPCWRGCCFGAGDAKQYTRLALMGLAKEKLSADELIKATGLGLRDLTPGELARIVKHVAGAGFDPNGLERAGGRLAGISWDGQVLKGSSKIPPGVAHYLRHVVFGQEWPAGTTIENYYHDLKAVIQDPESEIFVSRFGEFWQIGFVRKSNELRGPEGHEFVIIDYRVAIGHWVTGFQPKTLSEVIDNDHRTEIKWLRIMK